jgi:hypothetical protein
LRVVVSHVSSAAAEDLGHPLFRTWLSRSASYGVEERFVTQETKRVNAELEGPSEEESKEDVVNDSLGTVDPADSTGLDSDEPGGNDKPSGEKT